MPRRSVRWRIAARSPAALSMVHWLSTMRSQSRQFEPKVSLLSSPEWRISSLFLIWKLRSNENAQPKRQNGYKIDQSGEAQHETEPAEERAALQQRMFTRDPESCRILQREDKRRGPLDRAERESISLCQVRYGFDHCCGKRDNDQRDKEPVQSRAYATGAVALFQNGVDTAAQ